MAYTDPRTWTTNELVTAAIMNTHVRDNFRATTSTIPKTADESVTSSAVLQDDDHLTFSIAANEVWYVCFVQWVSCASASVDYKNAFEGPASVTYHLSSYGANTAGTFAYTNHRSVADTSTWIAGSTGNLLLSEGIVVNGGTAGNFRLQWSQAVSNGTATVLKRGSTLIRSKLA